MMGMAPVLTAPMVWRKPRPANRTRRASDLTPEEQDHVKAALRVLRTRLGGTAKLAEALTMNAGTLSWMLSRTGKPSAGTALRAARLAGVSVEELLSGAWPRPGSCPHCGRGGT
jgi:DNA-binding phage protein